MTVKTDFSWVNAVDTASLYATSEASTLPVANLADPRFGRVWRSLSSTAYFTIKFAAATSINVLALAGCNLGPSDTVRHRLYDADGVTVLYDSTAIACAVQPDYNLHVHLLPQAYSPSFWRCDFVGTSRAASGYFDIARAWAGPVWQPSVGISIGYDEMWNDDADNSRSKLSGSFIAGDGPRYRTFNCQLKWMLEADKAQAKEMARVAGRTGQILFIPKESGDIPREAILGHIDKTQPITAPQITVPPRYGQSFTFIQDI